MAESNRAEHQHKVEETPSEAIIVKVKKLENSGGGVFGPPAWFHSTVSANFQM